jgi:hypothetical protein
MHASGRGLNVIIPCDADTWGNPRSCSEIIADVETNQQGREELLNCHSNNRE